MFEFLMDIGNYADRVVWRDDFEWGFVSTARVSDGDHPFETAVRSELYEDKDGETDHMIIVEAYDSREDAEAGHARWVATMTSETPPDVLEDCCNGGLAQILDAAGDRPRETRVKATT